MEPTNLIWLDGAAVPWEDATVHVLSHALHYGTGVFEGIRAYETEQGTAVFRLTDHMDRLHRSAKAYAMEIEWSVGRPREGGQGAADPRTSWKRGYVRPIVFLELGAVGLNPANARVRSAIITWRWGAYLGEDGVRNGIPRPGLIVASLLGRHVSERQGDRHLHQQHPGQERGHQERLRRGHHAQHERRDRRRLGREPVSRA